VSTLEFIPKKPPVFIIGSPRSGTTLLRLMLTCHPEICVPPEGGWLLQLYPRYRNLPLTIGTLTAFVDDLLKTPKIEEWNLNRDQLLDYLERNSPSNYANLAERIYFFHASRFGKSRWGDKNNSYLNRIKKIANIFPEAQFLHIIRDGRDVACSYQDLAALKGQRYAPVLPNNIVGAAYSWKKNVQRIQNGFNRIKVRRFGPEPGKDPSKGMCILR
jgi:hypothetical protein